MKAIIISDIAGHYDLLQEKLLPLKVDIDENYIDDNILLIFNGDLIDRGPKSMEIVHKVDNLIKKYPDQIRIHIGNHEANYFSANPHTFSWDKFFPEAVEIFNSWFNKNQMVLVTGLKTDIGDVLVSHAGLTNDYWRFLDKPKNIEEIILQLDNLKNNNDVHMWNAGDMLGISNGNPGVFWASLTEVVSSWLNNASQDDPDIHQVVGHSNLFDWNIHRWWSNNPYIQNNTVLFSKLRQSLTVINGKMYIGTDPGHEKYPVINWQPYVLDNVRIVKPFKK